MFDNMLATLLAIVTIFNLLTQIIKNTQEIIEKREKRKQKQEEQDNNKK